MNKRISAGIKIIGFSFITINFIACSKSDTTPPPTDLCAGKTIVINATPTSSEPCDAAIDVTATGSNNFSYKLNSGGTYQGSGKFTNLAPGNYTVFAKDGDGCEKSVAVTVIGSSGSPGTLFTTVKSLVAARCQSCHNSTITNGGMNFQVECNIVIYKERIKIRTVDEATMPLTGPLPQSEKDIISNWINAGGKYSD